MKRTKFYIDWPKSKTGKIKVEGYVSNAGNVGWHHDGSGYRTTHIHTGLRMGGMVFASLEKAEQFANYLEDKFPMNLANADVLLSKIPASFLLDVQKLEGQVIE